MPNTCTETFWRNRPAPKRIILRGEPLGYAVYRCQIGGLAPDMWMPLGFAVRDAVIAQHGGDEHLEQHGHHTVLVPNYVSSDPTGENIRYAP